MGTTTPQTPTVATTTVHDTEEQSIPNATSSAINSSSTPAPPTTPLHPSVATATAPTPNNTTDTEPSELQETTSRMSIDTPPPSTTPAPMEIEESTPSAIGTSQSAYRATPTLNAPTASIPAPQT